MKLVSETEADKLIHKRIFDLLGSMSEGEYIKIIHVLLGTAVMFSDGGEKFLEYINNSKMLEEKELTAVDLIYTQFASKFKEMRENHLVEMDQK